MRFIRSLNWVHIILILSLPIILALINPNWMFNSEILSDDYFYLGHILDLYGYSDWYPANATYFGERISWLIPSAIIHHLLPIPIDNFIADLYVYYIGMFAMYGIIQRMISNRVAIIITLLMGNYPLFMRAVGWDYVDGVTIAYITVCLFFIVQSSQSKHPHWYLVLAGMSAMLTLAAHLFTIAFMPAIFIFYLANRKPTHIKMLLRDTGFVIFGIVLMYIILGTFYLHIHGEWLLFRDSLNFSQDFTDSRDPRSYIFSAFKKPSVWNIFTLVILISGLVAFFHRRNDRKNPHFIHLYHALGLFAAFYTPFIIFGTHGYLFTVYSIYNTYLIPATFIIFASLIAPRFSSYNLKHYHQLTFLAFFIPILPFLTFNILPLAQIPTYIGVISPTLPLFIILGVILPLYRIKQHAIIILLFSLFGYILGLSPFYTWRTYGVPLTYSNNRYEAQKIYEASANIADLVNRQFPENKSDRVFQFWILGEKNNPDPLEIIFSQIGAIFYTRASSRVSDDLSNGIPKTQNLIILSTRYTPQEMIPLVTNTLSKHHTIAETLTPHTIQYGWGEIYVLFAKISPQ